MIKVFRIETWNGSSQTPVRSTLAKPVIPSNEVTVSLSLNDSTQTNVLHKSQNRHKESLQ